MTVLARIRGWLGGADVVAPRDNNGVVRVGHVSCWGNHSRYYEHGEPVPHSPRGRSTYSVRTEEGWWLNVSEGKVYGWSKRKPVFRLAKWS